LAFAVYLAPLLNQDIGNAGQHTFEIKQWVSHDDSVMQTKFPNGPFMVPAALLDHGNGLPHFPFGFEEAK
jgi:hypothetical protein